MITVKEIIKQVKHSELSGVNLGNSKTVGVNENHYNEIISNINAGLLEIRAKTNTPQGIVLLTLDDHINVYRLSDMYLDTNTESEEVVKYLSVPVGQHLRKNINRIIDIAPVDTTKEQVDINNTRNPKSVWIRSNSILEVPDPTLWDKLRITYEYGAELIEKDYDNDTSVLKDTVEIDQARIRPLVKFIVYQMMSARPHLDPQNTRYAKRTEFYNSIVETVQNESVIPNENDDMAIFERNGFI